MADVSDVTGKRAGGQTTLGLKQYRALHSIAR